MLTEHNMSSEELNRFNLKGYVINSSYSRQKVKNGGVLVLSKLGLKWRQVNYFQLEQLKED